MLSSRLVTMFVFLGLFWFNNGDNAILTCTTNNAPVFQIRFNPGLQNVNKDIEVTGEAPFSDCTFNGTTNGTGKLIINNIETISFSCFNMFTHSLTAYVSFSFDNNRIHNVELIPGFLNFLSFLGPVTYTGQINPPLYGADTLIVVFEFLGDFLASDPEFTCISPGFGGFNGPATLTLE